MLNIELDTKPSLLDSLKNKWVFMHSRQETILEPSFHTYDLVLLKIKEIQDLPDIAGYMITIEPGSQIGNFKDRYGFPDKVPGPYMVCVGYKEAVEFLANQIDNEKNKEMAKTFDIIKKLNKEK